MPHLEQAERQIGDRPELIEYRQALFALSAANMEAWRAFGELHPSRPQGMAAGGILQSEIYFWLLLRGREIDRRLVLKLGALDRVFLAYQAEEAKKTPQTG